MARTGRPITENPRAYKVSARLTEEELTLKLMQEDKD